MAESRCVAYMSCPCRQFHSAETVLSSIYSETEAEKLSLWLKGSEVTVEGSEFVVAGKGECDGLLNGRCPNRVGAAFVILNAVRDGCRHYLDSPTDPISNSVSVPTYESVFPALVTDPSQSSSAESNSNWKDTSSGFPAQGSVTQRSDNPNILVGRKKKKQQHLVAGNNINHPHADNFPVLKKGAQSQNLAIDSRGASVSKSSRPGPKRRIRPVPAGNTLNSPWVNRKAPNNATKLPSKSRPATRGNIADLPSEEPADFTKMRHLSIITKTDRLNREKIESSLVCSNDGRKSKQKVAERNRGNVPNRHTNPSEVKAEVKVSFTGCDKTVCNDGELLSSKGENFLESFAVQNKSPGCINGDATSAENKALSLSRLENIYTAVIQNQLAPSIPLELHLLIRMISVDLDKPPPLLSKKKPRNEIKYLFSTAYSCRDFAGHVLTHISTILLNLGHEIIKSLVVLPSLMKALPRVVSKLHLALDGEKKIFIFESAKSPIVGNANTPLITVPFNQTRDSKHNYRSRDQTQLFTNREESRDKFMYQLRAFQEIRGTVVDPSQADMYFGDIKMACREMLHGLMPGNMFWFAEYFCDLLLQIGLVPKLHRRFTTKASQKSKSSQKLFLDQKSQASSSLSAAQPDQFFSGHQEFFYIFLRSVDSYHFGVHLRRRLVGLISGMSAIDELKGLEQRIAKLQLLAKFLGMLCFSPNWSNTYEDPSNSTNLALKTASEEALVQINCTVPLIPLRKYIEEAWREGRMLMVIPWVVEYLRMAMWDNLSLEASYYREIFILLRSIHRKIATDAISRRIPYGSNMQLISFQLESLFADVLGLSNSERLPDVTLPSRRSISETPADDVVGLGIADIDGQNAELDHLHFVFSKIFLFSFSSHLEELHKLIADLNDNKGKLSSTTITPKKLRPYAISAGLDNDSVSRKLFSVTMLSTPESGNKMQRRLFSQWSKGDQSDIQKKLVDTFFHQHRDLQELCEFIVGWSLKNVSSILVKQYISPMLDEKAPITQSLSLEAYVKLLRSIEEESTTSVLELVQGKCESYVRDSMTVLCPPLVNPGVLDVAIKLSVQHAFRNCEAAVESSLRMEVKRRIDLFIKREAKSSTPKPIVQQSKGQFFSSDCDQLTRRTSLPIKHLESATCVLKDAAKKPHENLWNVPEQAKHILQETNNLMEEFFSKQFGTYEQHSKEIGVVKRFGVCLLHLTQLWFSGENWQYQNIPPLMQDSLSVSALLYGKGFSNRELIEVGVSICNQHHLKIILIWCGGAGIKKDMIESDSKLKVQEEIEKVGSILVGIASSGLVSVSTLEQSLLNIFDEAEIKQAIRSVSLFCAQKLNGKHCSNGKWMKEGDLVMSRLRKRLVKEGFHNVM